MNGYRQDRWVYWRSMVDGNQIEWLNKLDCLLMAMVDNIDHEGWFKGDSKNGMEG